MYILLKKMRFYGLLLSLILIFFLSMCESKGGKEKPASVVQLNVKQFAGSQSCQSCHQDIYRKHQQTPHFLTSRPADEEYIKGSLDSGKNEFNYTRHLKVVAEKRAEGIFQVAYSDGQEALKKPFDIIIGSGRKGQTYLFWYENSLYQLPISYYTPLDNWSNSPGYPEDKILFNRHIPGRCLECHGTYADSKLSDDGIEMYERSKLIFGVDCERCHAPAARHVAFHQKNPGEKKGRYIVNASSLTRQQNLDACALCHSGLRKHIKPAFSFMAGDKLDDFSLPDYQTDSAGYLDVHGNQYGLLTASKCFQKSRMDCSSCHNVHEKESNNLELFSQRCMSCHQENKNFCKLTISSDLKKNCIDCHMPMLPSGKIQLQVARKTKVTPDLVRTHKIAMYLTENKEADKIADFIKKLK